MFRGVYLLVLIFILPSAACTAAAPATFPAAKKIAFKIFQHHPVTLYCGCRYEGKTVDLTSCNMSSALPIARANYIEWEHMMPAEYFGRTHRCWTESLCKNKTNGKAYGGRKCCEKIDSEFQKKEAELYNLWPAVGSVNQARSNYQFGTLANKRGFYGCEFESNKELKRAEPPDRAKGIVARANLFMAARYHVRLEHDQQEIYQQWNNAFPPDAWELQWAEQVAAIVGYSNPYIS